jgi:hypothetical protein
MLFILTVLRFSMANQPGKLRGTYQVKNHFAVGMCFKLDLWAKVFSEGDIVVDFAIDSEYHSVIFVDERLRSSVWIRVLSFR